MPSEWRVLELQAMWIRTSNPMVLDRVNDLEDVLVRVLHSLMGLPEPGDIAGDGGPAIVVARTLTPSLAVQMDPGVVLGIATDLGTRTSHWAILARSLEIPSVGGLVDVSRRVETGEEAILDGRIGRIVVVPDERDRAVYRERRVQIQEWQEELSGNHTRGRCHSRRPAGCPPRQPGHPRRGGAAQGARSGGHRPLPDGIPRRRP